MANRIDTALAAARSAGRPALAPFVTVGYPTVEASIDVTEAVVGAGADLVELGVPFSDPLADGLTVQKASHQALQNGVTVRACLDAVGVLRERGIQAPLILMGYYNPFLRYGVERLVRDSVEAGVDGFIVPDLPPEEGEAFRRFCDGGGIYVIPLLAPTSTDERIARACKGSGGFIYSVSLTGVTGARSRLQTGVSALVERIRRHTKLPVLVGFGVSKREDVETLSEFADGVLVGSALLDAVGRAPSDKVAEAAYRFVAGLRGDTDQ